MTFAEERAEQYRYEAWIAMWRAITWVNLLAVQYGINPMDLDATVYYVQRFAESTTDYSHARIEARIAAEKERAA